MSKLSAYSAATSINDPDLVVLEALQSVKLHLGMDVAFACEIVRDTVFVRRAVGAEDMAGVIYEGAILPIRDVYCDPIFNPETPSFVADTAMMPAFERLQIHRDADIRSIISVPMIRGDGTLYGTFVCFSHQPVASLNTRDLDVVRMFADLSAHAINKKQRERQNRFVLERKINKMIHDGGLSIYMQPIVSLRNRNVKAVEALSRFNAPGNHSVEWWFAEAGRANMQVALEIAAIEKALDTLAALPKPIYLTLNASPATIASPSFLIALQHAPPNRIIVELTEHQEIADTAALMRTLDVLRQRQIGVAVDDVGAGYAGLNTILRLKPNVMKLDRSLVMDIHEDTAKQSLTSALVYFATQQNAFLIAEGVEKPEEDAKLRSLGVRLGQGFLYGRPAPADEQIAGIAATYADNVVRFPTIKQA